MILYNMKVYCNVFSVLIYSFSSKVLQSSFLVASLILKQRLDWKIAPVTRE